MHPQKRNELRRRHTAKAVFGALLLTCVCCGYRFPSDFDSLHFDQKISAYERYLSDNGSPREEARASIASHGKIAADRMAQYLAGERSGIPKTEAITIIYLVQTRHCLLKGGPAEDALESSILQESMTPGEETAARITLEAIKSDFTVLSNSRPCN